MENHRNLARAAVTGALALVLCALPSGVFAQDRVELTIVAPASSETVHDNHGDVRVSVSAQGLRAGVAAAFRPLIDGTPHGPDQPTPSFVLETSIAANTCCRCCWSMARGK